MTHSACRCRRYRAGSIVEAEFSFAAHLVRGHYRINLIIRNPIDAVFYVAAENAAHFSVQETRSYDGVVEIDPRLHIDNITSDHAISTELLR